MSKAANFQRAPYFITNVFFPFVSLIADKFLANKWIENFRKKPGKVSHIRQLWRDNLNSWFGCYFVPFIGHCELEWTWKRRIILSQRLTQHKWNDIARADSEYTWFWGEVSVPPGKLFIYFYLFIFIYFYLADSNNMQQQSSIHKYDSTMMTIKDHVHCQARHPWNINSDLFLIISFRK